jgi:PAS domain S-box-containing protein
MSKTSPIHSGGQAQDLPLGDSLGDSLLLAPYEWFTSLLSSDHAMVWRTDAASLKAVFVNKATETILGYPSADWLKKQDFWADRIHPDDRPLVMELAAKAIRDRQGYSANYRMIAADGRLVWLRTVVHVVTESEHTKELVGIAFEISDLKLHEEQLLRSEELVSCIFKSLHGELAVLDKTGLIIAVNEAWDRFARENGMDPADVSRGADYLEVCRRAARSGDALAGEALEGIEAVLRGSCEQMLLEYPCNAPTVSRWFAMRVTPLRGRDGGAVIVHANITQLKETQDSLYKALAEVQRLKNKLEEENVYLRQKTKMDKGHHRIIGQSQAVRRVLTQVEQVAGTDSTVLILGETGTGKELVAASIHDSSPRRDRTLVSVNCAAMPGPLVESELFGREKGAFTGSLSRQVGRFELADASTIFLDEIGELSPETQAKLLRVLESRQVERLGNPKPVAINVRVIAATNRNLEKAVSDGKFRQDLYYRLNVFPINVPPLRERREDIPLLAWAFVDEFAKTFNKDIQSIERESMESLQRYSWPGNVRELRNVIERAMIVGTGPKLRVQLPAAVTLSVSTTGRKLEEVEREHVLSMLENTGWRIRGANGAADRLGLKPTTLEARMSKLGIRRPNLRSGV